MSTSTMELLGNKFEYHQVPINQIRVDAIFDKAKQRREVSGVYLGDEPLKPTTRFWTSLCARFGISDNIFSLYSHAEVFQRIAEIRNSDNVRLCIERGADGAQPKLLALSNPDKPFIAPDDLNGVLERFGGERISYSDGIVSSLHSPRVGLDFDIAGDKFCNRFTMFAPIDGYGKPNLYLTMLRLVCANGAVAMSHMFRSEVGIGKDSEDVRPSLVRTLDSFNNEEGFAALRSRFEASVNSYASVYETNVLYKQLVRTLNSRDGLIPDIGGMTPEGAKYVASLLGHEGKTRVPVARNDDDQVIPEAVPLLSAFHRMTGDTQVIYGLANMDAMSEKRQRTLPTKARVYDVINFATEIATHYTNPAAGRQLAGFVGGLVANEYDLEGTANEVKDFQDFLIDRKIKAGVTAGVVHN